MINKGDKLVLTLKTNNVSFDKLYLGKNDDLAKTPAIQGMQEANGGYSFTFEVDADKAGTTVPIVLGKKDGTLVHQTAALSCSSGKQNTGSNSDTGADRDSGPDCNPDSE